MNNFRGQIWVETVIYVLIALVLIGAVLAFIRPKIEEARDKAIIENSLNLLKDMDGIINEMKGAAGNQRTPEVNIKNGFIELRGESDEIYFEFDGQYEYSESETSIKNGNINIITSKRGDSYRIKMSRSYAGEINITFDGKDADKQLSASSIPYIIVITNNGYNQSLGGTQINFQIK